MITTAAVLDGAGRTTEAACSVLPPSPRLRVPWSCRTTNPLAFLSFQLDVERCPGILGSL
jgi:hypothetical protein